MKHFLTVFFIVLMMVSATILVSAFVKPNHPKKLDPVKLVIKMTPVFNGKPLILNTNFYGNDNGDSMFINEFKFYISAITFKNKNNTIYVEPNSVYLINAEDPSTWLSIPEINDGDYTSISFNIGIDSATSVSGSLEGELDPAKGMYWAWNTGYINAKLVGQSRQCNTFHHVFEYHIGGYLNPANTLRKVSLPLNAMKINSSRHNLIEIYADAGEWFRTPLSIALSKTNNIVIPGKQAMMMANNYTDMFSVHSNLFWE